MSSTASAAAAVTARISPPLERDADWRLAPALLREIDRLLRDWRASPPARAQCDSPADTPTQRGGAHGWRPAARNPSGSPLAGEPPGSNHG